MKLNDYLYYIGMFSALFDEKSHGYESIIQELNGNVTIGDDLFLQYSLLKAQQRVDSGPVVHYLDVSLLRGPYMISKTTFIKPFKPGEEFGGTSLKSKEDYILTRNSGELEETKKPLIPKQYVVAYQTFSQPVTRDMQKSLMSYTKSILINCKEKAKESEEKRF